MSPSLAKIIIATSFLSEFIGAIFLSLGVLRPETIKTAGEKLHALVMKEPRSMIPKCAYMQIFEAKTDNAIVKSCVVQLAVYFLTGLLAAFATSLAVLIISIWGFIALTYGSQITLYVLFPSVGVLLATAGFFALFEDRLPNEVHGLRRLIKSIIKVSVKISMVLYPLYWIVGRILLLFTMYIPLLWYRGLKIVHSRGVGWAFGLLGVLLLLLGLVLQLAVSLTVK